jgi:hypothetical protein
LKKLYEEMSLIGKRIVLRDHSHSHYLRQISLDRRRSLLKIVSDNFTVKSILTVRDPVDSYLSIKKLGWVHFSPSSFDEYCRRYLLFIEDHKASDVYKYEDFVTDPKSVLLQMCESLDLKYADHFIDTFDTFIFSGDSGRKEATISQRPRRDLDADYVSEITESRHYIEVVEKLNYTVFNS